MCVGERAHVVLHARLGGTSWSDHKWLCWAWEFPCMSSSSHWKAAREVNTSLATTYRWASVQQKIWAKTAAEQKYELGYKIFQNLKLTFLTATLAWKLFLIYLEYVWTGVTVFSINRTGTKAPDMKLMAHLSMKQREIIKATDLFYNSL